MLTTRGIPPPQRVLSLIGSFALRLRAAALDVRARRRAYARMPKPVPWDWAQPRLVPLLAGPYFDRPGEELVRGVDRCGVTIVFGIDLGAGVMPFVDRPVAERWECTPEQIHAASLANLDRRAAVIQARHTTTGTLCGHMVRVLQRPAWASSLLLSSAHLARIFGPHDQVFVAAGHGTLISLGIDAPSHVAAALVREYEAKELYPLLLDPFALEDGSVHWAGAQDYEAYDDDE